MAPSVGPIRSMAARWKPGLGAASSDSNWSKAGMPVVPASSSWARVDGSVGSDDTSINCPAPVMASGGAAPPPPCKHWLADGGFGVTSRWRPSQAACSDGEANWAGWAVRVVQVCPESVDHFWTERPMVAWAAPLFTLATTDRLARV